MLGLTLTLAALVAAATATGYIDGREYVYSYKGQIYTGFPRIKPQYSGYAFQSNIIIQPHGDYALIKVDSVQKDQFNGEFEDVAKHPHSYEELPMHAEVLTKPFKVYREHGIVSHFEVTKGEPIFSVNLKRGLIALFNLNLNEAEVVPSEEDNVQKPDPDRHYYKVYEKGVLGDCETAYVIEHHPYHKIPQNNIVLNVTKVRNYHKCNLSPNKEYGIFHGYDCGTAEHENSHTVHGTAQFHYDIRGHRHQYVIEKITTVGEVAYTPFPLEGQTIATNINRYLELVEERPVTIPLELGEETDNYSSLLFEFDSHKKFKDAVDLKKPHYMYHLTGRKVPLDVINRQFEELVHVYDDDTYQEKIRDKNFPEKFVELLRSLGSVGYEEIEELYKQYADIPQTGATVEQNRYRSLFFDSLVNLGTNPALLFGKYLVENKKIQSEEAAYFFAQIPSHLKEVSETLLDNFQELCDHDSVTEHENAHIACVLALSNVLHYHCVVQYEPESPVSQEKQDYCQPKDTLKYFEYIANKFEETEDEKLKTAYLKAAGNVGLKEILPYVRTFADGSGNANRYLRGNAIWSLLNVGIRYPEKVKDILVPILFNQSENYEYRIAAYDILGLIESELYEIEGLARALKQDPDTQFRSYVYSSFKSLANSTHPCDKKISKDAHYALRILEDVRDEFELYDYTFSKDHQVSGYNRDYDYGGSTRFSYLASDTGYIPRSMYLGLEDFLGGKSFPTLGFGFQQYGLEKFFDKLLGPDGSIGKKSIFDLFKKRDKRDTSGFDEELKELMGKIVNLPKIQYEPIHGEVYVEYMGNHISFFNFDDKTFEDFFKNGRFTIPNLPALFHKIPEYVYQRFTLTVDKMYVTPTESGIPMIFDYKQSIYYYHRNKESSFKVEPGFFSEERGGKWPDHVKAETDGHIALDKNVIASVGVIMPFDQVIFGAGINRICSLSVPLKMKLDLDVAEKKLNTKWTPVAPHEIFHFKYEPHTFVDSYVNSEFTSQENLYLPVKRSNRKEMKESFLHDFFGFGFDVHADYETEFNDKGSWLRFLVEKDYREKFYYLYTNPNFEPYDISVRFSQAAEGATKEVKGSIQYKSFASEYTEPEFSNEGFEDYKISQMIPERGHFSASILEAEVTGEGDKERKARASVSFSTSLKGNPYKVNLYYNRSPFQKSETENLKICGSSYLKFPSGNHTRILFKLNTTELDYTVQSKIKLHFGKDCSSDQKIEVDSRFKSTDEQRDLDARRNEPVTPERDNPYAYYYQECMKDRQRGVIYGDNCIMYVENLVKKTYGYRFHTKFENLSPGFLNFTYKVGDWFKHDLFYNADHNTIDVHNPQDELLVDVDYSMKVPIADIRVSKPNSISHYNHVYLPKFHGLKAGFPYELLQYEYSTIEVFCQLEGKSVYTFDRFEYDVPPFDCYTVISRDCSPNAYFTVLGADIEHPKYHRAMKMYIANHKIEGFPTSGSADSGLSFTVDDKEVEVLADTPFFYYENEGDPEPLFRIENHNVLSAVYFRKYNLIVEYDGTGILLFLSPYYRNKLCGLCGNYNGQKYDNVPTPQGCQYVDEKAYVRAFAIPSDTCSPAGAKQMCPREGGFGCTKLRTKIVENTEAKTTCFSTEPVAECEFHCKARSTASQKISFHCLPSKDDSTKALVRQQAHRVIHEVRRKSKDHEAEVEVPDMCLQI